MKNNKKKMPIELVQVYTKYYVPFILGYTLRFLNLIPDTKPVQVLLVISTLYAVLGSFNFLVGRRKFMKSTYKQPNTEYHDLTVLAKELDKVYKSERVDASFINDYLTNVFIRYQFTEIKSDHPTHNSYLTVSGEVYQFSMKYVKKILTGELELDIPSSDNKVHHYELDFNFETLVPYMKKFISLYRDMFKKGLVNDNNKGVIYFRNFIIVWLIDHHFLTDALLEDEEIYIRKEV